MARRWFARRTCRAESVVGPLSDARDWVAERTGLVLDSYFAAPKMAWLRRNRTTAGVVTRTDTWLGHQLSGELATDASTASRSLLTDLDSGRWDDGLRDLRRMLRGPAYARRLTDAAMSADAVVAPRPW